MYVRLSSWRQHHHLRLLQGLLCWIIYNWEELHLALIPFCLISEHSFDSNASFVPICACPQRRSKLALKKPFRLHQMLISSLDFPSSLPFELAFVILSLIFLRFGQAGRFFPLAFLINKTLNNRLWLRSLGSVFHCVLFLPGSLLPLWLDLLLFTLPAFISSKDSGSNWRLLHWQGTSVEDVAKVDSFYYKLENALREPPVYLGSSSLSGVC